MFMAELLTETISTLASAKKQKQVRDALVMQMTIADVSVAVIDQTKLAAAKRSIRH